LTTRGAGLPANGEMIRQLRRRVSQAEFADMCGLGLITIQRAERGAALAAWTLSIIADTLSRIVGRPVSLEEITRNK
jgi:transcriptional regulator with XRE-family HTH domain